MTEIRDGYLVRWNGEELEASPDGESVRLYRTDAADGFERVGPERYRKIVPTAEAGQVRYVTTVCRWRDQPFRVIAERGDRLRLEYTGGRAPVAESLGLELFDRGVYQGWVPAEEVTDLREQWH